MEREKLNSVESESYVCSECGADVTIKDKVCPKCGADVREIDEEGQNEFEDKIQEKEDIKTNIESVYFKIAIIGLIYFLLAVIPPNDAFTVLLVILIIIGTIAGRAIEEQIIINSAIDKSLTKQNSIGDINKSPFLSYDGRIGRLKFFLLFLLFFVVLPFVLLIILEWGADYSGYYSGAPIYTIITVIRTLIGSAIIVILLSLVFVKRFHDLNRPGTHFWLMVIPVYSTYLWLLLIFKRGTTGFNKYGADPLLKESS